MAVTPVFLVWLFGQGGGPIFGQGEGGTARSASLVDYLGLDEHAEPLRGSFNADIGKVRILMLVAPT